MICVCSFHKYLKITFKKFLITVERVITSFKMSFPFFNNLTAMKSILSLNENNIKQSEKKVHNELQSFEFFIKIICLIM